MCGPSFGNFIKLMKLHCTGSWVSTRRRHAHTYTYVYNSIQANTNEYKFCTKGVSNHAGPIQTNTHEYTIQCKSSSSKSGGGGPSSSHGSIVTATRRHHETHPSESVILRRPGLGPRRPRRPMMSNCPVLADGCPHKQWFPRCFWRATAGGGLGLWTRIQVHSDSSSDSDWQVPLALYDSEEGTTRRVRLRGGMDSE